MLASRFPILTFRNERARDVMVIRTVIVDDEQPARQELCFLLEQFDDINIVGQANDGVDAMQVIRQRKPKLVFLDIQMPGHTGFDVARELILRAVDTCVVFVTAYDQHAIDAFEINAVDYLLKPVEPIRLEQTIDRVRSRLMTDRDGAMADVLLERVLNQLNQRRPSPDQVALKVGEHFQLVRSDDIIYASLSDDVITVVAGRLTGTSNFRSLDELQSKLNPEIFWRVHRSHLVNINKVKEIVPWFSRNYILKMKDAKGTEIPVSRAQTKRLREHLSL